MFKKLLVSVMLMSVFLHTAMAANSHPVIELDKMKREQIFTGPYSYFVPPYSNYYFHHMDELGYKLDWMTTGAHIYPLKSAKTPFVLNYRYKGKTYTLDDYFKRNQVLGFLVIKDDQIITERYFNGASRHSRFLSNSMQKSFISTLIGIAIEEGKINSINDPITQYLSELANSGFKNVTIKNLLTMTSAIDESENYKDKNSGIYPFADALIHGAESLSTYLTKLKAKTDVKPGTVFDYESVNSQVLGMLLERVTGMSLSEYTQEKIWQKIGAERDAFLFRSAKQPEQCAFGCLAATLRDYARFGLMMMNKGSLAGKRVVNADWVKEATRSHIDVIRNGKVDEGYGYQWWVPANNKMGIFAALGVYGQIIFVDPVHHIVIVEASAWPGDYKQDQWREMLTVLKAVTAKISQRV